MNNKVGVFLGDELKAYGFGSGHPFGTDRYTAFISEFDKRVLRDKVQLFATAKATHTDLVRFHTDEYIKRVRYQSKTGMGYLDYGDTPAFMGAYEAACAVVGTTLSAVEHLMRNQCKRAFIPIAGLHHARRDMAAGFCVFNDCGVAIETLRKVHGIHQIAYVDIDAHHGDGVFYAFEDDADLCFVDFHEDGRSLYPGTGSSDETGKGRAVGTKLNIPLPAYATDDHIYEYWEQVEVFINRAQPQFILLQCGADSIGGDPITHLQLTPQAHRFVAKRLLRLADEYCEGRLLAMGGGGYNRTNLANAWCAVIEAMLD